MEMLGIGKRAAAEFYDFDRHDTVSFVRWIYFIAYERWRLPASKGGALWGAGPVGG